MAAQEGSAAILIFLGFGAGPSSLTVPLTEPTAAKSTGAAAGVTAGAFSVVSSFLPRSEEHTSELQSRLHLVCRLLLEKKKKIKTKEQRRTRDLRLDDDGLSTH